jgi:anti-sigma regulatory factor (Ser/Thr protein kinase)
LVLVTSVTNPDEVGRAAVDRGAARVSPRRAPWSGIADDDVSGRELSKILSVDYGNVAVARRIVRSLLEEVGVANEVVDDMVLVTSELVTNAFEHGSSDSVELAVTTSAQDVYVAVSSVGIADQLASPEAWSVAEPLALTGRGLGIVRLLADEVRVAVQGPSICITAWRFLG